MPPLHSKSNAQSDFKHKQLPKLAISAWATAAGRSRVLAAAEHDAADVDADSMADVVGALVMFPTHAFAGAWILVG